MRICLDIQPLLKILQIKEWFWKRQVKEVQRKHTSISETLQWIKLKFTANVLKKYVWEVWQSLCQCILWKIRHEFENFSEPNLYVILLSTKCLKYLVIINYFTYCFPKHMLLKQMIMLWFYNLQRISCLSMTRIDGRVHSQRNCKQKSLFKTPQPS